MEIKKTHNAAIDPYKNRLQNVEESKEGLNIKTSPQTRNTSSDTINLSQEARFRTIALSAAKQTPDMRTEKIAALKAQLENGSYTVDSQKIASGLLKTEALLQKSLKD